MTPKRVIQYVIMILSENYQLPLAVVVFVPLKYHSHRTVHEGRAGRQSVVVR
jgi:hypothetical protein